MLATSTHDNKRSEDVRTRISLLSEIPDRWAEALHQWSQLNAPAWKNRTPDRHAEYLLYQTLIGAWPITQERCWQYMLKACREAKIRTSWHEPNTGYEENIRGFVEGVFQTPEFIASLEAFIAPLILPGRINSLAQTLIKMIAPGVPDFYQGTELWDLSLVDPDNRRPVDFELRSDLLQRCSSLTASEVLADWDSGLPKLWMTTRVLALRRERAADFSRSELVSAAGGAGRASRKSARISPRRQSHCGGAALQHDRERGMGRHAAAAAAGSLEELLHRRIDARRRRRRGSVRVLSGGAADSRRRVIFSVWAPFAKSVDLVTQERRVAMQSDARGYWRAEADASSVQVATNMPSMEALRCRIRARAGSRTECTALRT